MNYKKFFLLFVIILFMIPTMSISGANVITTPLPDPSYFSPEITISEDIRDDYSPAIAFNWKHDEYLVVWESVGPGGFHDVYAQRVSSTGKLLSWFAVGNSLNGKAEPSVAYDPVTDRYLVVWAYDYYGNGSDWDIYGRFITWNGPNPALTEFVICDWTSNQAHPAVAYARVAEEFMVVWRNVAIETPGYISGRMVWDSTGMSDHFTISSGGVNRDFPDVTYNFTRNEFLVVWDIEIAPDDRDIYGHRYQGNGLPISNEFIIADYIGANEERPSAAACYKADQYLIAWQSDRGSGGTEYAIYVRYLNGDAIPGDLYLMNDFSKMQINADVSCNASGYEYLVAWQYEYVQDKFGIWARVLYPNKGMTPEFEVIAPGWIENRQVPAIGAGNSSYLLAWEHQRFDDGKYDLHGKLLRYVKYLPIVQRQ